MVSAMQAGEGSTHHLMLSVPAALAPLTLAFVVHVTPPAVGGTGVTAGARRPRPHFIMPLRGRHFSALVGCSSGSSVQQGVALLPDGASQQPASAAGAGAGKGSPTAVLDVSAQGQQRATVNFAMRCRGAERVCLVLLRPHGESGAHEQWGQLELVLDPVLNRTGELWHVAGRWPKRLSREAGACYGPVGQQDRLPGWLGLHPQCFRPSCH